MADVTFTVDGKELTAAAGKLIIVSCKIDVIIVSSFF